MKSIMCAFFAIASIFTIGCAQKTECRRMLDIIEPHVEATRKIQNEDRAPGALPTRAIRDLAGEYKRVSKILNGLEFSSSRGNSSTSAPEPLMNKYRLDSSLLAEQFDKLAAAIEKGNATELKKIQGAITDTSFSESQVVTDVSGYCQEY